MQIIKKSCDNIKIDINDIKKFIYNVNSNLNEYNKLFTKRNREINYKDTFYYLVKYNLDNNSSYESININLFNNDENNDITSQSYINKRKKITTEQLNNINNNLIDSFYNHLNLKKKNRLIAVDGSQLNFLSSLNKHFKLSGNNNYTYMYLSCLFDVETMTPINYLISSDDERTMLIKQLSCLNINDILIADRGYYSYELIKEIEKNNLKFIFRITKNLDYYKNNIDIIQSKKEGCIEINYNDNKYKLYWYTTRTKIDNINKEIEKVNNKITLIKNNELILKNKLKSSNDKYNILFEKNKILIKELKNKNITDKKRKKLNNDLNLNRINKNKLKDESNNTQNEITKLKKEFNDLILLKKNLELDNDSDYIILTNDLSKSVDDIKDIYRKRWSIETHFKFIKQETKINKMNNKNIDYIKQNILITQFIFILESYMNNLLMKFKKDENKRIKKSCSLESLYNKLLYLILNEDENEIKLILEKMTKLLKFLIKIIKTEKYKPRIKKRPQKNYYNSNYG